MKRARFRLSICAAFGLLLGAVRSANGTEVAYHFDRNAFAATARIGDGPYVALTDSGNLLAFDPASCALLPERVPRSPATCLSVTTSGAVAGLDDGRIVSVDVPSLQMKRTGAVDGRPVWMGRRRSGALPVAHGFAPDKPFGWGDRGLASLVVEELGTSRFLRIPFVATTLFLDFARSPVARRRQGRVGRSPRGGRSREVDRARARPPSGRRLRDRLRSSVLNPDAIINWYIESRGPFPGPFCVSLLSRGAHRSRESVDLSTPARRPAGRRARLAAPLSTRRTCRRGGPAGVCRRDRRP